MWFIHFAMLFHMWVMADDISSRDPNDVNPCGQYNAYMGNLCQFDRYEAVKYEIDHNPKCADCYSWQGQLREKTKAPSVTIEAPADQGQEQKGTR